MRAFYFARRRRDSLEHFQQKWTPALPRKMRKNKELERLTEPSEVKTALGRRSYWKMGI